MRLWPDSVVKEIFDLGFNCRMEEMAGAHTRDHASAFRTRHLVSLAQEKVEGLCLRPVMLSQDPPWSPQIGHMRATLILRGSIS